MNLFIAYVIGGLILTLSPVAGGEDAGDIDALKERRQQVGRMLEALGQQRAVLASGADSLASRIDSLKAEDPDSEGLQDALRASMVLVKQLTALDQRVEALTLRRAELLDELRLAYDWRIGQIFQRLANESRPELLLYLAQLQQEREALGERLAPGQLRYGGEMVIGQDDGPEEIRFKIDLMEDMAARLAAEERHLQKRLGRLEEERRLRERMNTFTGQLSLFDEHLPEGRVLRRSERAADAGFDGTRLVGADPAESDLAEASMVPEMEEAVPVPELVSQSRLDPAGGGAGREFGSSSLMFELSRIKARQLEVRQLEALLHERIASFRHRLQRLKDGSE